MKIYPQFVLWSYVVLPAICILLSPTLLLSIAKAQQARARAVSNAVNLRTRAAAALARNQARNHQRQLTPSGHYANGFAQMPMYRRGTRDLVDQKALLAIAGINNQRVKRKTHWDQQEEAMGMLQNMWNMNSFNNLGTGPLRNAAIEPSELNPSEEIIGSARIYDNTQRHPTFTHSGPFFQRNIYDETLGAEVPVGIDDDRLSAEDESFELMDDSSIASPENEKRSHHRRHRKHKKHDDDSDEYGGHYPYNYYRTGNTNDDRRILEQIELSPELMSLQMTESRNNKNSKDHTYSNYYPGHYYGRTNEKEEQLGTTAKNVPEEMMEAEQRLEAHTPLASNMYKQPLQLTEGAPGSEIFEQKSEKFPVVGMELYYARNNEERPLEMTNPNIPKEANLQEQLPLQSQREMLRPEQLSDASANVQFFGKDHPELTEQPIMTNANQPQQETLIMPTDSAHAQTNQSPTLEEVGCEHDDEIFGKRPNSEGYYNNAHHYDPDEYYQRAVQEVAEINEKIAEAANKRKAHEPIINADQSAYYLPSTKPMSSDSDYSHAQAPVEFTKLDETLNGEHFINQQKVGTVHQMSAYPQTVLDSSMRDASPHHHKHPHSHGFEHIHSFKYDVQPVPSSLYLPPPPHGAIYNQHQYGALNQGHSYSQANGHAQSISQRPLISTGGFGHSGSFSQAGALTNSGVGLNTFGQSTGGGLVPIGNNGFAQSQAHANAISNGGGFGSNGFNIPAGSFAQSNAQAQAQSASQTFSSGFAHSVAQATAQATAEATAGTQSQLFQSPLNFRSSDSLDGHLEETRSAMPHLEKLPTPALAHDMKAKVKRSSKSSDNVYNALDALGLASDIVHSALNLNHLTNSNHETEAETENGKEIASLVTNIVDHSVKKGQKVEENADSSKTAEAQPDNIDTTETLGSETTDISSIASIVNSGLKFKREYIEGINSAASIMNNTNNPARQPSGVENPHYNSGYIIKSRDGIESQPKQSDVFKKSEEYLNPPKEPTETLRNLGKSKYDDMHHNDENETTVNGDKLDEQRSNNLKEQFSEFPQQSHLDNNRRLTDDNFNARSYFDSSMNVGLDREATAENRYITTELPLIAAVEPISQEKPNSTSAELTEERRDYLVKNKKNTSNKDNDEDYNCTTTEPPRTSTTDESTSAIADISKPTQIYSGSTDKPQNSKEDGSDEVQPDSSEENLKLIITELPLASVTSQNIPREEIETTVKPNVASNADQERQYGENKADLLDTQRNDGVESNSSEKNDENHNSSTTEFPLASMTKSNLSGNVRHENSDFTEDMVGSPRSSQVSAESSEESHEDRKYYSTEIYPTSFNLYPKIPSTNTEKYVKNISTLAPDEIEEIQFSIPDSTLKPISVDLTTENPTTIASLEEAPTTKHFVFENNGSNIETANDVNSSPVVKSQPSKLILNDPIDVNPFASIEAEMGALTDAEKDLFIKQEVKLISEIIAETMKNKSVVKILDDQAIAKQVNSNEKVLSPNLFQSGHERYSNFERFHPEYNRQARSTSAADQAFDVILGAQKEKLESIEKEATDDDDLLMISFIANGIITDLEQRKNEVEQDITTQSSRQASSTRRTRRGIRSLNLLAAKELMNNPNAKVDIPKTLENVGAIVKQTFESPTAPLYHVRNMIGNTKNSVMSAAKIPPNNILVPSNYEIAQLPDQKDQNQRLGGINQKLLNSRDEMGDVARTPADLPHDDSLGIMSTFQKIGGIVKESVDNSKKVAMHANDAASDAKNAVHAAKHAVPRLILPGQSIPLLATRMSFPGSNPIVTKPVLLAPRLLNMHEDRVWAKEEMPKDFVGMGDILDAVGVSKPDQPEIPLQEIPLNPTVARRLNQWSLSNPNLGATNNIENKNEESVGAMQALNSAENSVGAKTLKEFFNKMRQEMKEIVTSQQEERKKKRMDKTRNAKTRLNANRKKDSRISKKTLKLQQQNNGIPYERSDFLTGNPIHYSSYDRLLDEMSNAPLPPEVLKIFTDDIPAPTGTEHLHQQTMETFESEPNYNAQSNDIMLTPEIPNMFQDSKTSNNSRSETISSGIKQPAESATKYEKTGQIDSTASLNNTNEKLGLFLEPELMKPFMGEASQDMFHSFMRENGDPSSTEETQNIISENHLKKLVGYPNNTKHFNAIVSSSTNRTLNNSLPATDSKLNETEGSLDDMVRQENLDHSLGAVNSLVLQEYANKHSKIESKSTTNINKALETNNFRNDKISDLQKPIYKHNKKYFQYHKGPQKTLDKNADQPEVLGNPAEINEDTNESHTEPSSLDSSERKSMIINDRSQIPFLGALDDDKVHQFLDQYNRHPPKFEHLDNKESLMYIAPVKSFMFSEEEDYDGYI